MPVGSRTDIIRKLATSPHATTLCFRATYRITVYTVRYSPLRCGRSHHLQIKSGRDCGYQAQAALCPQRRKVRQQTPIAITPTYPQIRRCQPVQYDDRFFHKNTVCLVYGVVHAGAVRMSSSCGRRLFLDTKTVSICSWRGCMCDAPHFLTTRPSSIRESIFLVRVMN